VVELTVRKVSYSKFRCELLVSSLWNPNLLDLGFGEHEFKPFGSDAIWIVS